ncbi:DUF402 domain-containing protein [Deinococcus rubellus]|uniref:DUF402 domain-containing protein n=1 Tax=Deinococcus rubellus TaxID=1889240 RepID=A0ABY5YDM1_9DEIO|nr:DUF402 domain-containing protein [Deinococcus rubellus]UWX63139.1 DUF402 domain-containing protein [Deinococcus rubellus]
MKRKVFDRRIWPRAISGEQTALNLPGGLIVDYRAGEVTAPKWVSVAGRALCILDSGYRWVHYAPSGATHALTVQLDASDRVQQLYVDVGEASGIGADGLPWMDDLYLDVVGLVDVQPDGRWQVTATEVIDQNELEEALQSGRVTPQQHAFAWAEADGVVSALHAQSFGPLEVMRRYLQDPYT